MELDRAEARRYMAIAARLNYLAPDRVDLGLSVKEAARNMSKPMIQDWEKLKRIGRYLVGRPRLISRFIWQPLQSIVTGYTDSDWAGCATTGRSTSGEILKAGAHMLKSYARHQKTVALFSAEAELHALVAAIDEVMGMIGMMNDMGWPATGVIYPDPNAALGIAQRQGAGKVRHVRSRRCGFRRSDRRAGCIIAKFGESENLQIF